VLPKTAAPSDGKSAGSIFYLCQTEKCEVHNRVTRYQPTPQEQAQRKKEALAERVEKLSRVRTLEAIRKKLPDVLSRPDLEMVASITSGVWATTTTAAFPTSTHGKRRRARPHGALNPWTTRKLRRRLCKQ